MEQNSNSTNNIDYMADTKTSRTVLSFEELKVLRERKLTQEEADFSEEHLSIVGTVRLHAGDSRPGEGNVSPVRPGALH